MVKGITHILKSNSTVQGLIGQNEVGDKYKVYPVVCPFPEKAPYLVVIQTGKVPIDCKGSQADTFIYTYDVYSFSENYDTTVTINQAVIDALAILTRATHNSVVFDEVRFTNEREGYDKDYHLYAKISSFEAQVDES
jgi:hypothetical protein